MRTEFKLLDIVDSPSKVSVYNYMKDKLDGLIESCVIYSVLGNYANGKGKEVLLDLMPAKYKRAYTKGNLTNGQTLDIIYKINDKLSSDSKIKPKIQERFSSVIVHEKIDSMREFRTKFLNNIHITSLDKGNKEDIDEYRNFIDITLSIIITESTSSALTLLSLVFLSDGQYEYVLEKIKSNPMQYSLLQKFLESVIDGYVERSNNIIINDHEVLELADESLQELKDHYEETITNLNDIIMDLQAKIKELERDKYSDSSNQEYKNRLDGKKIVILGDITRQNDYKRILDSYKYKSLNIVDGREATTYTKNLINTADVVFAITDRCKHATTSMVDTNKLILIPINGIDAFGKAIKNYNEGVI